MSAPGASRTTACRPSAALSPCARSSSESCSPGSEWVIAFGFRIRSLVDRRRLPDRPRLRCPAGPRLRLSFMAEGIPSPRESRRSIEPFRFLSQPGNLPTPIDLHTHQFLKEWGGGGGERGTGAAHDMGGSSRQVWAVYRRKGDLDGRAMHGSNDNHPTAWMIRTISALDIARGFVVFFCVHLNFCFHSYFTQFNTIV